MSYLSLVYVPRVTLATWLVMRWANPENSYAVNPQAGDVAGGRAEFIPAPRMHPGWIRGWHGTAPPASPDTATAQSEVKGEPSPSGTYWPWSRPALAQFFQILTDLISSWLEHLPRLGAVYSARSARKYMR
jgi:hypothetical protein